MPGENLQETLQLEAHLAAFLRQLHIARQDLIVVAFSGGPDSCALLHGLKRVARDFALRLVAVHLDHGLDPDSARRAHAASRLAAAWQIPLTVKRLPPLSPGPRALSREAAARRLRYEALAQFAEEQRARFIATAHHDDDQAETVLLRLLFGSGLGGLAGIQRQQGQVIRPLLGLRRSTLLAYLQHQQVAWVDDPTNLMLEVPRNRVRHCLLPRLATADPQIVARLCRLADQAGRLNERLAARFAAALAPRLLKERPGVAIARSSLAQLPVPLLPYALSWLHRTAGAPYPASARSRWELQRQLNLGGRARVGCDCGDGWRWEGDRRELRLVRWVRLGPAQPTPPNFAYTVETPGQVELREADLKVRLLRSEPRERSRASSRQPALTASST